MGKRGEDGEGHDVLTQSRQPDGDGATRGILAVPG
jgi:hypothetical protein